MSVAGLAGVVAATMALAVTGQASTAAAGRSHAIRAVSTGPGAELVDTIPIARPGATHPRVAMSLTARRLGRIRPGEMLHMNAEAQVTLTCFKAGLPRCIGRPYSYSPRVRTRLVLAPSKRIAAGRKVLPLSTWGALTCSGTRPNRNHHCVLVYPQIDATIPGRSRLPCKPSHCFVNLVITASNPHAKPGNKLIVGADRPNGRVAHNKGRLAAVEVPPHTRPHTHRFLTRHRRSVSMPEHENGGRRVVYSIRVPSPHRGDVLFVNATQITSLADVPYTAYISDQMFLADRASAVRPSHPSAGRQAGIITAANGFNCTQGPSQFQSPCASVKAGVIAIRHRPQGKLFVNLVSRSKPKHRGARPGDRARILRGGFLQVTRYRAR